MGCSNPPVPQCNRDHGSEILVDASQDVREHDHRVGGNGRVRLIVDWVVGQTGTNFGTRCGTIVYAIAEYPVY